ncbi:MAG: family 78 glycoside hydrolase catalytic domain [Pirellulales bacterium]
MSHRENFTRHYDLTDRVVQGANAVGGVIADGWYAGYVGFGGQRDLYGDKIRLRAQLVVEFTDGTSRVIATGADWKGSTGPLEEADFLMGERYDARKEMPGWDRSGFDVAAWHRVDVTESIAARVEAHPGPPVGRLPSIKPVRVTQPQKGRFVVDLGQNFAGMVRLKVRGPRGQEITLRHAERLNPDGTIYTKNLRSARAIDHYVCRGGGDVEVWQPRFTFHGFQYVEVTGYPGTLTADDVTGIPLSSDTPVTGRFECSDPMVNKLIRNIYWTQRMNFIDVPTDCPQRDERLGWTGDAQIYVHAASLIADTQAFFTKWLVDLTDAQRADGQFPMVAPLKSKGVSADGGPAWADAGVICPWTIYEMYGDRRILERHYASMAKFIKFCKNRSTSDLLPPEKFHCFGDWLSIRADTPKDVIYMAYFAHSTRLMSRIAAALDKKEDAARYEQLFQRIKSSFNVAYVQPDGRIKGNTQTCYVLAIAFDLVDGTRRDQAAQYLIDDIRERDWHLSTGFIGTKDLMLVLSQIDRTDVAYRLLHNTTFPSWGFSIEQGATSIWERWNGWTPEDGFFNPGMNSFAHYSFGAVAQWIFGTVGGINTQGAGFQRIVLCPQPGGKLTWAKTDYQSVHGEIVTDWKRDGDGVRLRVVIPANTTATVYVPVVEGAVVQEGDQPANEAPGVQLLRRTETAAVYEVGSGEYIFSSGAKEGGAR